MSEIPDLSKLKSNGQATPPPDPAAPIQAAAAFLVIIGENGDVVVSGDTTQTVMVRREINPEDIYAAASLICKDITVQQTAALTQQALMQMGALLQQQAQAQGLRSKLNLP